jgi:hypothetical protein
VIRLVLFIENISGGMLPDSFACDISEGSYLGPGWQAPPFRSSKELDRNKDGIYICFIIRQAGNLQEFSLNLSSYLLALEPRRLSFSEEKECVRGFFCARGSGP